MSLFFIGRRCLRRFSTNNNASGGDGGGRRRRNPNKFKFDTPEHKPLTPETSNIKWVPGPLRDHIMTEKLPHVQRQLDDVFNRVYDNVHNNIIDKSRISKIMNDAEKEFWVDDDAPVPRQPSIDTMKKAIMQRMEYWRQTDDRDLFQAKIPQIVSMGLWTRRHMTHQGRKMSFYSMHIAGDYNGIIGWGIGTAKDAAAAVKRSKKNIQKNLLFVPRWERRTIPHAVEGRFNRTRVRLWPASEGAGVRGCFEVWAVAELLGIRDIGSKVISKSRNTISIMYAMFHALYQLRSRTEIAQACGKSVVSLREAPDSENRRHGEVLLPKREELMARITRIHKIMRRSMNAVEELRFNIKLKEILGRTGMSVDGSMDIHDLSSGLYPESRPAPSVILADSKEISYGGEQFDDTPEEMFKKFADTIDIEKEMRDLHEYLNPTMRQYWIQRKTERPTFNSAAEQRNQEHDVKERDRIRDIGPFNTTDLDKP